MLRVQLERVSLLRHVQFPVLNTIYNKLQLHAHLFPSEMRMLILNYAMLQSRESRNDHGRL